MKLFRNQLLTVLLLSGPAWGQASASAPFAPSASATVATTTANPLVQAIRGAPDPSSTIAAYTRGIAAAGSVGTTELDQAYVHRMFELGALELADAQAHDLISRNAADATTRGIAACNDAMRGKAHDAIYNLKLALLYRAADPFLLRTAGQFVAWYDTRPAEGPTLTKDDVAGIEGLRAAGMGRQEFADAYRITTEARQRSQAQAQAPGHAQAASGSAPPLTATTTTQRSSSDFSSSASYQTASSSSSSDYSRSGYSSQYTSSGYGYQYPYSYSSYGYGSYYPYSYGYGSSSYGSGSILTLSDRDSQRARKAIDGHGGVIPKDRLGPPTNPNKPLGGAAPPAGPGGGAAQPPGAPPPGAGRPPEPAGGSGAPPQMPRPPMQPPRPPMMQPPHLPGPPRPPLP